MILNTADVRIESTEFTGNRASEVGGGLYTKTTKETDLRIKNSVFEANTVALHTNGIVRCGGFIPHSSTPYLELCAGRLLKHFDELDFICCFLTVIDTLCAETHLLEERGSLW